MLGKQKIFIEQKSHLKNYCFSMKNELTNYLMSVCQ